jgi:hypothetical protein
MYDPVETVIKCNRKEKFEMCDLNSMSYQILKMFKAKQQVEEVGYKYVLQTIVMLGTNAYGVSLDTVLFKSIPLSVFSHVGN